MAKIPQQESLIHVYYLKCSMHIQTSSFPLVHNTQRYIINSPGLGVAYQINAIRVWCLYFCVGAKKDQDFRRSSDIGSHVF